MKKTFLFGIVAAMLATACTEEESFNQIASGEGIQFISSVASRATDNSFETGDEIGISMYANGAFASGATNVKYTAVDGNTFTGTEITWEAAGGATSADFIGVYPYKDGSISDGKYSFTLSGGDKLSENDVMYAHTPNVRNGTEAVSLNFKHKLVKVVMNVKDQDGNAVTGAKMTINKQQLEGTLDLTTGDVTSADVAGNNLEFASNKAIHGEYQTIVMPSAATQGRIITITANGKTYPCPVDMYAFESGKKITFSATIYTDGTVTSEGKVTITADVTDWSTQRVEEGWIFGEDADFNITDKPSYQLAANMSLSSIPSTIEVDGTLNENDVYSFVYTRNDATEAATITVGAEDGSSREFTLPAGSTSGTMLIPVSQYNTTGMTISSEDEGITLTKVLVYTNEDIVVPIELWSTDAPTAGNGISNTNAWPNDILNFTVPENVRSVLTPGATLNIYYNSYSTINFNYYNPETGLYGTDGPSLSSGATDNTEGKYLSLTVLSPLIKAIKTNDYVVGLTGSGNEITRIVLVPTETPLSENIVWMGESLPMWGDYATVSLPLQEDDIAVGSIFRVTFRSSDETNQTAPVGKISFGTTVWNNDTQKIDVTVLSDLSDLKVTIPDPSKPNEGYVEVAVTNEMYNAFQSNNILGGGTPLAIMGGSTKSTFSGNIILQVEILPAVTAE